MVEKGGFDPVYNVIHFYKIVRMNVTIYQNDSIYKTPFRFKKDVMAAVGRLLYNLSNFQSKRENCK